MNIFEPLNSFFDAIYVITLDGYEKRQESIKSVMKGLDYEFWPGTDKRQLSPDLMMNTSLYDDKVHKTTKRTHRSMTLSEYACACSHRNIYQHMIDNNLQRVLIFEDDAVPNRSELVHFIERMNALPKDWDVVLFDYYDCIYPGMLGRLKTILYKLCHKLHISNWQNVPISMIDQMLMREFDPHFYHAGRLSGAHAYCLTLEAAKHYVKYQTPIILQADRIFYYYQAVQNLKVFACKAPMFTLGEVSKVSSIQIR